MKELTDKYQIGEKLGEGGMGAVFRGEITGFQGFTRTVAIKMLHDIYDGQKLARARFAREARICGSLRHHNVVSVLDFDRSNTDEPFLVMEYVDGVDLRAFMKSADLSNLSLDASVYIAAEVLHALAYAHAQGVIHRDVKPRNVLISRSGDVKLTDFGLAKFCNHNSASLTRKSAVKGTVGYIAPEIAKREAVDQRADLFMVGVMLYELITGQLPFGKEHLSETIRRMFAGPPEEPRALRHDVPDSLNALILRLLRAQPDERHDSADEVRRELSVCADLARGAEEVTALARTDHEAYANARALARKEDPRATGTSNCSADTARLGAHTRSARHGPAGRSLSCSSRWQQSRSSLEACSSSDTRPGQPMPSTPTHRPLPRTSSRLIPSKALQRQSATKRLRRLRRSHRPIACQRLRNLRNRKNRRPMTAPTKRQSHVLGVEASDSVDCQHSLSLRNQRPQARLRRVAPYSVMEPISTNRIALCPDDLWYRINLTTTNESR